MKSSVVRVPLLLLAALPFFFVSCAPPNRGGVKSPPKVALSTSLRGVNVPGGEMTWGQNNVTNPVSGTDYLFVSNRDIDYLVEKGANFGRVLFSWEGMQPNGIETPFPTTGNSGTYIAAFNEVVTYATSKGVYVLIEPHGGDSSDFARYKGKLVGSSAVPNAAFADLWSRLAQQFKGNPYVSFGLTNEPNTMSTVQWFQAAQAAIVAIRATGATNRIFVPGNGWTNADSWTDTWYDTASPPVSNATAWLQYIKDPLNNTVISVHSYFDADAGGSGTDIVSPTIGVDRVSVTVNWARAHGLKVHLSEFGTTSSAEAQTAVSNLLVYMNSNSDVLIGWSWWAYGPPAWWASYQFTLDPNSSYTVDAPQMAWLSPYFIGVKPPAPAPTPSPTPTPTPPPPPTFVVSSKLTYDWGTGYCEEFYLDNKTPAPITWKSVTFNLADGHLRGQGSTWGAVFPNLNATGVVTATPEWSTQVASTATLTVGMCLNRGPSKKNATLVRVTY